MDEVANKTVTKCSRPHGQILYEKDTSGNYEPETLFTEDRTQVPKQLYGQKEEIIFGEDNDSSGYDSGGFDDDCDARPFRKEEIYFDAKAFQKKVDERKKEF